MFKKDWDTAVLIPTAVIYTHPTKKMAEQTVEIFEKYADEKNPGD